jgi:hypothetical protein
MLKLRNRRGLIGALLLALIVRALIPAGFMPATDRPFSFQICPDGYPAHLLKTASPVVASAADPPHADHGHADHHDHASGHADHDDDGTHRHAAAGSENCAFAAVASAGPHGWSATFSVPAAIAQAPEFIYTAPAVQPLRFRVSQPRGPPALS